MRNLQEQEFDGSEMSFSTYITLKARGAHHYTAVPVPSLARLPTPGGFSCAATASPSPADLKGKLVIPPE